MAVDYPTYPVTTLAQAEDMIIFTGNQIHDIMNADATSVIEAEDGAIPSIRKALVDNMYFKPPQDWVSSTQVTDPLQLKQFTDGGWYFAPTATASAPVTLGTTPIGDTNWKPWNKDQAAVYQHAKRLAAEAGYNMVSGSFYFGGTLDSVDDVLFYEGDGKYYSWSGAFPKVVHAGSTPASTGGVGAGAWVDRTDDSLRYEIRETVFQNMKRQAAEAGLNLVDGSFEEGAVISGWPDVVWSQTLGIYLQWHLDEAKTVAAGSTPTNIGTDWIDKFTKPVITEIARKFKGNKSLLVSEMGFNTGNTTTDGNANAAIANIVFAAALEADVKEIIMDIPVYLNEGYNFANGSYNKTNGERVVGWTDFLFTKTEPGNEFLSSANLEDGGGLAIKQHYEDGTPIPEPIAFDGSNIKIKGKSAKDTIKVVIAGDSISTTWADSLSLGITEQDLIVAELKKQNPGVNIDFVNRAIGGQTWINFNTTPTTFPDWYTNHSKVWYQYVIDENPDIVIYAFGMNDNPINMGTMVVPINAIRAALPNAHFVMITSLLPSRATTFGYNKSTDIITFDGLRFQEMRNQAAGIERTYAEFYGFSVWDLNRYFKQCRDGEDVVATEMEEVSATLVNGAYESGITTDFSFEALVDVSNPNYVKGKNISVLCGGDSAEDFIFIGSNTGNTKFSVSAKSEYITAGSKIYFGVDTDVDIPDTDYYLTVTVLQNRCTVWVNTVLPDVGVFGDGILLADFRVIRHGGVINAKIGYSGFASGPFGDIRVMLGQRKKTKKTITDKEMWGKGDDTPDIKSPYGGNGINHPSGQGLAKIVSTVLESQNLTMTFEDSKLPVKAGPKITQNSTRPATAIYHPETDRITLIGQCQTTNGVSNPVFAGDTLLTVSIPEGSKIAFPAFVSSVCMEGSSFTSRLFRVKSNGDISLETYSPAAGVNFVFNATF